MIRMISPVRIFIIGVFFIYIININVNMIDKLIFSFRLGVFVCFRARVRKKTLKLLELIPRLVI